METRTYNAIEQIDSLLQTGLTYSKAGKTAKDCVGVDKDMKTILIFGYVKEWTLRIKSEESFVYLVRDDFSIERVPVTYSEGFIIIDTKEIRKIASQLSNGRRKDVSHVRGNAYNTENLRLQIDGIVSKKFLLRSERSYTKLNNVNGLGSSSLNGIYMKRKATQDPEFAPLLKRSLISYLL
jgi:hypothetical protein